MKTREDKATDPRQNKARQNKTKQNKTKQNKTKQNKTRKEDKANIPYLHCIARQDIVSFVDLWNLIQNAVSSTKTRQDKMKSRRSKQT